MKNETRENNISTLLNHFAELQQKGWDIFGATQIDFLRIVEGNDDETIAMCAELMSMQDPRK